MSYTFTPEEVEHCKASMVKPACLAALRDIADGQFIVSLTKDGRDCFVEEFDRKVVRDPEYPDRKCLLAGAWPLFRAGMIDQFGVVTADGRAFLEKMGVVS